MSPQIKPKPLKINGILLLDKPLGLSSNAALQIIKRLYNAEKAGHTGSLDPLASGMLPICFGEATKFSQFLLEADKSYRFQCKLGVTTTTDDAEGEILETHEITNLSLNKIEKVLATFRGHITQIPSMYSALKHKGQPLYKLARKGIEVPREPRPVTIYHLELIDFASDVLTLEVKCSKGTYVRTLAADIGKALQCGAHVLTLRRLSVGMFQENQMIAMATVEKNISAEFLLPVDAMLANYPEVFLSEATAFYLQKGQPVFVPNTPTKGLVKLLTKSGDFLGVGEIMPDGKIAAKRLCAK
jgi:tRNA pseudouridine55 synthase